MKKVFFFVLLAGAFAACNNDAERTRATQDSIRRADSLKQVWLADSIANAQRLANDTLGGGVNALDDSLRNR